MRRTQPSGVITSRRWKASCGSTAWRSTTSPLNEKLAAQPATVALYDTLVRTAPDIADLCSDRAFEDVAAFGDAGLTRYCIRDPEKFIQRRARSLTRLLSLPRRPSAWDGEDADRLSSSPTNRYITAVQLTLGTLAATGEAARVPDLHRLAIDLVPETVRPRVAAALQ